MQRSLLATSAEPKAVQLSALPNRAATPRGETTAQRPRLEPAFRRAPRAEVTARPCAPARRGCPSSGHRAPRGGRSGTSRAHGGSPPRRPRSIRTRGPCRPAARSPVRSRRPARSRTSRGSAASAASAWADQHVLRWTAQETETHRGRACRAPATARAPDVRHRSHRPASRNRWRPESARARSFGPCSCESARRSPCTESSGPDS